MGEETWGWFFYIIITRNQYQVTIPLNWHFRRHFDIKSVKGGEIKTFTLPLPDVAHHDVDKGVLYEAQEHEEGAGGHEHVYGLDTEGNEEQKQ